MVFAFLIFSYISFFLSVITNLKGMVSITPMENAKTFVNGNLISESTVLHHVSTHLRSSIMLGLNVVLYHQMLSIVRPVLL